MDEHEARHLAVGDEALAQRLGAVAGLVDDREDPLEPRAVQLDDRRDELLRLLPAARVEVLELAAQLLDARDEVPGAGSVRLVLAQVPQHIPVGVCITFLTRPPPVYMWTPHGRHGSKLRTARMMSTPLKSSGPFSSKIGVFCTASS